MINSVQSKKSDEGWDSITSSFEGFTKTEKDSKISCDGLTILRARLFNSYFNQISLTGRH